MSCQCEVPAKCEWTLELPYALATGVPRAGGKSEKAEFGKCSDLMKLLETEPTAQPKISFLLSRLSAERSGEEPQKMARKFLGLLARSGTERDRGAIKLQCVRRRLASPRARRVVIIVLSRKRFAHWLELVHKTKKHPFGCFFAYRYSVYVYMPSAAFTFASSKPTITSSPILITGTPI